MKTVYQTLGKLLILSLIISLMVACGQQQAPAEAPAEEAEAPAEEAAPVEEEVMEEATEAPATEEAMAEEAEAPAEEEAAGEMAEGAPYKIGFVVAATGGAASLGEAENMTAEMIAAQLAESGITGPDGVKHPVEVIIIDSESNPDSAAAAASRLITEEAVDVLVAGTTSGESLAMVPIATENEVPMISMASAETIVFDPEAGETRRWIFKTPQTNTHTAIWHAEYLAAQGVSTACFLYENTGFGQDALATAEAALAEKGIEIVYSDAFERTDTEFPQVQSVQSSGCEAVLIGSLVPGAVNVMGAIRDFMPDIIISQNHGVCNAQFRELDPAVVEGVAFPCGRLLVADELPDDDPQKAVLQQYINDYTQFTEGADVNTFGGHAWDALQWAITGLSSLEEGMDLAARRVAIRDTIEGITDWPGTGGIFNLSPDDHTGLEYTGLTFVKIENGEYTYYPAEEWGGTIDESEGREIEAEASEETAATGEQGTPYKIGVVVAETGGASTLGLPERNTAQMIAEQLAEQGVVGPDGVSHAVEVIILDSESNPDTAASAISRLINEEEVDAVLGGSTTGESLAMVPIATENEVVFVSMGSAEAVIVDPETGETRTWVFKTPHVNSQVAAWHTEYLASQGITSVCYLYENTGYGQDVLNTGMAAMEAAGIEVLQSDAFERADTEFPQIASVQSSGCEAVVIGSLMPGAVNAMAAVRDFLPDIPVLHSGGICNEEFLTLDPAVVEGALVTCPKLLVPDEIPADDPQKAVLDQYIADYADFTGGEAADSFGGHAWDGLQWILISLSSLEDGLDLAGRRAAIRDAMESEVTGWPGTGGIFTLDPDDHLGVKDYETALTMTRVENGDFAYHPRDEWGQ